MNQAIPLVSVILPTYQREAILCQTIDQLLVQDYPNYEVIVVDQTPAHLAETTNYLNEHQERIRYYKREQPGLPAARNFGVAVSRGEIVIFIDDDIKIQQNWISSHAANFQDAKIGGVSGRVLEKGDTSVKTTQVLQVSPFGRVIGNRSSTLRVPVQWASGGNSSFRKDLVTKAGGFDEKFTGNAIFEDVDFSFRLRRLGYNIIFDPEAVVFHLAENSGGCKTRMNDRVNYYYWYIRNKTLFIYKNYTSPRKEIMLFSIYVRALKVGLLETYSGKNMLFLLGAIHHGIQSYKNSTQVVI